MTRLTAALLRLTCILGLIVPLFAQAAFADDLTNDVDCKTPPDRPCFLKESGLPLRLLVKPGANVYLEKNEGSKKINNNPAPFSILLAYSIEDVSYEKDNFNAKGWFKVGFSSKAPDGYIKAEDVVVWKQALAVAYLNPGISQRKPVLMFDSSSSLNTAITDFATKKKTAESFYADVTAGKVPPGIVSRETNLWVDIDKTFYLMPILSYINYDQLSTQGNVLALQVAALTNKRKSQQSKACDIRKEGGQECIREQSKTSASRLALDVVFVIDTTASMQPHIDAVAGAVREASQALEQKQTTSDNLRFGVVGYRDVVEMSPGLEYLTKNFTPKLLTGGEFRDLLKTGIISEAKVGSGDEPEEVFAGMKVGIASNWTPNAAHMIILIGDASSHPIGHPKNTTGLSERSVAELAKQAHVVVASLFVGDPQGSDGIIAQQQFKAMASGDGESDSAYSVVQSNGEGGLQESLRDAITRVSETIKKGRFDSIAASDKDSDKGKESGAPSKGKSADQAVLGAVRAALVDYLGKEAQPPASINAWVLDHDPTDWKKKAFDVRVMVQKGQLQELTALIEALLEKFRANKSSSASFFDSLQNAGATTSLDLKISDTQQFSGSAAVPRWIKSLPYKSEILSMSLEEFRQAPPDDRTRLENKLDNLVHLYNDLLNRVDAWVDLNDQGTPDDRVHLLELSNLP